MSARYRLGVDIGGTFTDATLLDKESGEVTVDKVSTTPRDPAVGFVDATLSILEKAAVEPGEVEFVVHATTVATNSIIEGKVAETGFVTTGGFRDMLELARQMRPSLYDLRFEKPPPPDPQAPMLRRARTARRARPCVARARRGRDAGGGAGARARGRRFGCDLLPALVRQPASRAPGGRDPAAGLPRRGDLALRRGRPGVPRVLPGQHDGDQRRRPPDRLTLHREHRGEAAGRRPAQRAPDHAVERRRLHLGRGTREARVHGRVRACCRGHRRDLPGHLARLPQRHLLRHGRDHGEDLSDPGRDSAGHQGLRGRGKAARAPGVPADPATRSGRR